MLCPIDVVRWKPIFWLTKLSWFGQNCHESCSTYFPPKMSEGVYQNNIYLKIVAPLLIVGMCPIVRIGKLLRTQKRMCVSMSGCAENASVVASYGLPDMYKKEIGLIYGQFLSTWLWKWTWLDPLKVGIANLGREMKDREMVETFISRSRQVENSWVPTNG